jgi:hypothetical protein
MTNFLIEYSVSPWQFRTKGKADGANLPRPGYEVVDVKHLPLK